MKNILILCFLLPTVFLSAQDFEWGIQSRATSSITSKNIATMSNGDVVVIGSNYGNTDIDPSSSTYTVTSNGSADVFLARYTASGALVWGFTVGGSMSDQGEAITIDSLDNIYISGVYRSTFDIDPGSSVHTLVGSSSASYTFLAKFNANGNLVWAHRFGNGGGNCQSYGLETRDNRLVLTGSFRGWVDFDPDTNNQVLHYGGISSLQYSHSGYYCMFTTDGELLWANMLENSSSSFVYDSWLDQNHNVFICGFFSHSMDMMPGSGVYTLEASVFANSDIYVAKYDSTGAFQFAFMVAASNAGIDQGREIIGDSAGNIFISGFFRSSADFNPGSGTAILSPVGNSDVFIAKYTNAGQYQWARKFGGIGYDQGWHLDINSDGHPMVTAAVNGSVDLDPTSGSYPTNSSNQDVAVVSLTNDGDFRSAMRLETTAGSFIGGAAYGPNNSLFVAGTFYDGIDLDASSTEDFDLALSFGSTFVELFLGKYSPCIEPNNTGIVVLDSAQCEGDSVTLTLDSAILNDAIYWSWLDGVCTTNEIDTGDTISLVLPSGLNEISVRGVGNCTYNTQCQSISIQAESLPEVYAGADTAVCSNDSMVLGANGANTFVWSNGHVNGELFDVQADSNVYVVTGTDVNGCSNFDSIVVFGITPPIFILNQFGDTLIADVGFEKYQWYSGSNPLLGDTFNVFVVDTVGQFIVLVTDTNGCTSNKSWTNLGFDVSIGKTNVRVYPNPSNGMFWISNEAVHSYQLYDMQGGLVYSGVIDQSRSVSLQHVIKETSVFTLVFRDQNETIISRQSIVVVR